MNGLLHRPYQVGCPSDLKLDRLLAEELDEPIRAEVEEHLLGCVACRGRVAKNEAFRSSFQASLPTFRRPFGVQARWRLWGWPLGAAGALAATAAVFLMMMDPPLDTDARRTTRSKGAPSLYYYVDRAGHAERGASGQSLTPGSRVQFVYDHSRPFWLALFSLDGTNGVDILFPAAEVAARMEPGRHRPLPTSLILDDGLGTETVFAFFCDSPVRLAPLRDVIRRQRGLLAPPPGCQVSRLTWEKQLAK